MNLVLSLIRRLLGLLVLAYEVIFSARPTVTRSTEEQARVDAMTRNWQLYQFPGCPFCFKVRQAIRRMGLKIDLVNASPGTPKAEELVEGGGELQTPCLKITDPTTQAARWLYESDDIIAFLEKQVAPVLAS